MGVEQVIGHTPEGEPITPPRPRCTTTTTTAAGDDALSP